jgi:hypothetical protein
MWCIGEITPEYGQRMYALLDLYQFPYCADEPVVCVDEKSKQLLAPKHPTVPVKPGRTARVEYERRGTRNLFIAVEPLAGWRQVQVTRQRKKEDFVQFIAQLLQGRYRHVQRLHLVLDNLNIHFAKVFRAVLGAKRAEKLLCRLVFHDTPKHASWLNMAEIEIGILDRQCLRGRTPSAHQLIAQIDAWQARRNLQRCTINWTFTRANADHKLSQLYVA